MFASGLAFICLIALAASDELNSSARLTCPPGWFMYKDNCFRVYKETKTWQEARALCMEQSDSADLVTIPDKGTTDFIIRNFDTNNDLDFWTGLNDIKEAGVYHWTRDNVKLKSYSYSDWAPNQPDNVDMRCVHLWIYSGHGWAKADCSSKRSVLCEQPIVKEVHEWRVLVTTSNETGLQMNDAVHMRIIGTKGKSQPVELDIIGTNDFEKGSRDEYLVPVEDIGTPKEVQVWHDKSGGYSHSWHLSSIELQRTENNKTNFVFNCDCWLSAKHGDGRLERTIPLSREETYWEAQVITSDLESAGTKADVSLVIFGMNGHTRDIPVQYSTDNGQQLARGQTHLLRFWTVDIGLPTRMKVKAKYDNEAVGWHLDKISLKNMNGAETYFFKCNCWIKMDGPSGETVVKELFWP